jgi:hypothetical protein
MPRSRWFASFLISILVFGVSIGASAQVQNRSELQAKMESLRAQIQAKEKVFLAPSAEDVADFAQFLRQPDTGIARLMPRETYDGKLLIRGGGSFYSFTRLSHNYGLGSDIGLERGQLSVGFAGADFGFLTSLGDAAIDAVTAEQPGVNFLVGFKTPSTEADARLQQRRAEIGFEEQGFMYRRSLAATVERTYAVRSVRYGTSDVLVVFRVIRQDSDGSLILVWKILKLFPVPQLVQ